MKQYWLKLAARIDVLTLRQRVGMFAAAAALLLLGWYNIALDPLMRQQTRLRAQIDAQQKSMLGMDADITTKVEAYAIDPDAGNRKRLLAVRAETDALSLSLSALQKGLVPPERIAPLLESILRSNGKLQLLSLTTLPVSSVGDALPPPPAPAAPGSASIVPKGTPTSAAVLAAAMEAAAPAKPSAPALPVAPKSKTAGLLFRHGVQVTVSGSYLDMIDYMASLEALPTQLFWGQARLEVQEYPKANLTLTLYTLSLDSKWMKL